METLSRYRETRKSVSVSKLHIPNHFLLYRYKNHVEQEKIQRNNWFSMFAVGFGCNWVRPLQPVC